ncbi:SDR family oxidoreductase [Oxalobacteraceae bacterium A2-2]
MKVLKVLVLGATGLIGSHVLRALRAAGCVAVGASRRRPEGETPDSWHALDFGAMTDTSDWDGVLSGVDAVVNCVGIIREAREGDFDRLHRAAPVALFAACERLGVRRVVQVSALGSHPDAETGYWRTKGAAEADLRGRRLSYAIVRPSLVYGDDGASSVMFRTLATLPLLAMPVAHTARVQPIHVDDLAEALVKLVLAPDAASTELALVGPRADTMAGYLASLRRGMRAPAALVLDLPLPIARLTARLAALIPSSALTPDAQLMLERSTDGSNTADAAPARALLGRPLRDPGSFTQPSQRADAVLAWGAPLLTLAMAVLWLWTAYVSWFGWPHEQSRAWLAACGIPAALQEPVLLGATLADAALGLLLLASLLRPRSWVWALQLLLVGVYTLLLSAFLPDFWLHPFGPLSKNLPLLALMAVMWRVSARRS